MGSRSHSLRLGDSGLVDCWVGLIVRGFVLLRMMVVGWVIDLILGVIEVVLAVCLSYRHV